MERAGVPGALHHRSPSILGVRVPGPACYMEIMSRLETLIERARSLPPDEQDALADEMQTWLDMPSPPDDFGADGSDAELERRVKAWRDSPTGIAAADLHARMKQQREKK